MLYSIKCYLRKRLKEASHGTLYLRLTFQTTHIYFNLYETVEVSEFDGKKGRVIKNPLAEKLNDFILSETCKLHQKILDYKLAGKKLTVELLKNLNTSHLNNTPIAELVNEYADLKNLGKQRRKHLKVTVNFWQKFKLPEYVEQVTRANILAYKKALPPESLHNTIVCHLVRLKTIFSFAVEKKLIAEHPMHSMNIGTYQSKKGYLSLDEVNRIINSADKFTKAENTIASMFLFQCFTGSRFADVIALKQSMIEKEGDTFYLNQTAQKTKKQSRNPLLPQAAALLPLIVGKKFENQYYNRALKEIAKKSGITKKITSHLARHSFATIALNKGVSVVAVQHLLGHSAIKTTLGYAELMDDTKLLELSKWND